MKSIKDHLTEFKANGLTIFPSVINADWVLQMRDTFDDLSSRIKNNNDKPTSAFTDVLEHKPELVLPVIYNSQILNFAEMIVGPHVQLESTTLRREPPQLATESHVSGFHRDMFAFYPENGVYHRPLLFNVLIYLQDLTDETGPLRINPGSHMRAIGISSKSIKQPHPKEVLVFPKAGDILMFHCSVLHSGSINLSTDYRYLFFITLNHSWLKHRANFQGPVCQNIIANARSQGNKRMLRLLGVDEEFVTRANCGFREPDEINWQRWIAEESNQKI